MAPGRLTAKNLLKGAYYSVEQAGHLLNDAVTLYEKGRYATAVVLAVFCQEELGRGRILLEERNRALSAGPVPIPFVRAKCDDHADKLRRGRVGAPVNLPPHILKNVLTELSKGLKSDGYDRALMQLTDSAKRRKKREPNDLVKKRQRALYVDPTDTGGWNRPSGVGQRECKLLIKDVLVDYELHRNHLLRNDNDLFDALYEWEDRPPLPLPLTI